MQENEWEGKHCKSSITRYTGNQRASGPPVLLSFLARSACGLTQGSADSRVCHGVAAQAATL